MKLELMDYLNCPFCKKSFDIKIFKREGQEVLDGVLGCECNGKYPIIRGVPRILPRGLLKFILEKYYGRFLARYKNKINVTGGKLKNKFDKDFSYNSKKRTLVSFGYQWKEFPKTYDEYYGQFLDWVSPLKKEFFKNKKILDAGCGTGVQSYFMGKFGGKCFSVDISQSVDVACEKNKNMKNNHVIQSDILNLPFKTKFDLVYCMGVLNHVPDPKGGIQQLIKHVKKDGFLILKVYSKEGNYFTINIIEKIMKKFARFIPRFVLKMICYVISLLLSIIIYLAYIPLNKVKGLSFITKNLPYNDYFLYISKYSLKLKQCIIYDVLSAPEVHYFSQNDLEELLKGLEIVSIKGGEFLSWRVLAKNI